MPNFYRNPSGKHINVVNGSSDENVNHGFNLDQSLESNICNQIFFNNNRFASKSVYYL